MQQQQQQSQQQQGGYYMHMNNMGNQQTAGNAQSSFSNLFISRVWLNVGTANMKNYLKSTGIDLIDIEKVSHTSSKFNSFRISVQKKDFYKVFKNPVWSSWGVICKPWKDRGNNNNYNNNRNNMWNNNNNLVANNYVSNVSYDAWDGTSYNLNNGQYGG